MKFYALEGTFSNRLPEESVLQKAIAAHLDYLKIGFATGYVLVSGPKVGAGGGIIIVKTDDIEKFCNDDPLVQAGIQEYRITEFTLHDCQDFLKNWFKY